MKIVVDAMGSDEHPGPEIAAAIEAEKLWGDLITLTGPKAMLEERVGPSMVEIVDAPEVLGITDKPVEAAKNKPNSSMARGIKLLKGDAGDAFITVGNTGGAMATALFTLGRIKGVKRPALSPIFPVRSSTAVVLDIGANVDCRPEYLLQFGIMGSIYAEIMLDRPNPRVALLSTGEEQGKGNQLIREADALLRRSELNFIGNLEPKDFYAGDADVVVTDGFSGNILLKTSEAVAALLVDTIRDELRSSPISALGGLLTRPAFLRVEALLDPAEYGAVPLLGVNGLVFIGHGRSNTRALVSAIRAARQAVSKGLLTALRAGLEPALRGIET